MPKINIKEYDNTTSGITSYENFTVVVPGFVSASTASAYAGVADENGIVEFTDQSTFKSLAGQVPSETPPITAVAPTALAIPSDEMDAFKFYNTYVDKLYTRAEDAEATTIGYLVEYDANTQTYYRYTKVIIPPAEFDESVQYYVIEPGNEGRDAVPGSVNNHYGNQIAYELLGMGYTVLYKQIVTSISELDSTAFWDCLRDKATYDFRYLVTGLLDNNTAANNRISEIAAYTNKNIDTYNPLTDGRGDCIALVDVKASAYSSTSSQATNINGIVAEVSNLTSADKNSFICAPTVTYTFNDTVYNNATLPASFHYLACAAYAFDTLGYREWYAVSGFTRGISKYTVAVTGCKLGDAAVNILQPRVQKAGSPNKAVNVVMKIRDSYYFFGNRTAALLPTVDSGNDLKASHFANIRQLCTTIKKRVYMACKKYQFDPNSTVLWINFKNEIEPTLAAMQSNQGIKDYDFIKVVSSKKALMSAIIRIVPIEAVEDFDISLTLEDSLSGAGTVIVSDND